MHKKRQGEKALIACMMAITLLGMTSDAARGMAARVREGVDERPSLEWEKDTLVRRQAGWELRIEYRQRGTRSEGQHGVLRQSGKIVEPETEEAFLETPFGFLKHYGDRTVPLWSVSGWNFEDRTLIRPSKAYREDNESRNRRSHNGES